MTGISNTPVKKTGDGGKNSRAQIRSSIFEAMPDYIAGKCNIGTAEINRRYRIGFTGLIFTIVFALMICLIKAHPVWRLLIFVPLFYSLSGFIQAWKKFCYVYGFRHVFSLRGKKEFSQVTDPASIRADQWTAVQIVLLVLLTSAVLTYVFFRL